MRPNRDAYTNLGAAYFGLRQFADAADNIQISLKLDAQDPLNWGNLGDALYWTPGLRLEAGAAYQKAIDLFRAQLKVNPRDAEAVGYIATYNAMLNQRKEAQDDLKHALDLAPKDPQVLFDAAFVYNHLGDTNQALDWLKKALDAGYSKSAVT